MHTTPPHERHFFKIFLGFFISFILCICVFGLIFLSSCQYLPQVCDDIEKIADNDAVTIKCDKDCFQKDTDVEVSVKVLNKAREIDP